MSSDVVLLEPWYRGSHRQWADGWKAHSRHRIHVLGGGDERWRRSLTTNPHLFADRLHTWPGPIDCLIASTPIDLAQVLGLARRRLGDTPVALYAHESQVAYPAGPNGGRAVGAMAADWASMAAADRVVVASEHHRQVLGTALPNFVSDLLDQQPDAHHRAADLVECIEVLPVGVDLPSPSTAEAADRAGPVRILWNHRWAYDKAPERFVHSMCVLAGEGHDFEVIALGDVERSGEPSLNRLRSNLGPRVVHAGRAEPDEYRRWLAAADVVVSTARHEFFGVAAVEALGAGARPLFPTRLSYPELVPDALGDELLYRGQLLDALRPLLGRPRTTLHRHRAATVAHVQKFGWETMAPEYDRLVDELIGAST
jgi:glycosyltransferase involved in cell wall biosynthesis